MLTVSRVQVLKPNYYQIGDQVHIYINNRLYTATAVKELEEDNTMLFVFDSCLSEKRRITRRHYRQFKGTFEDTYLFKFLVKLINKVPTKIKRQMVPFENGSYFRLFEKDDLAPSSKNAISYLTEDSKRLIRFFGNNASNYWTQTQNKEDKSEFYYISYNGKPEEYSEWSDVSYGIVPLFKLKNY